MFSKSYIIPPWIDIRLYCIELSLARYNEFYIYRVTSLCAPNITAQQNQCREKCLNIHYKEKTIWSWPKWQKSSQETTVEVAKQSEKSQVGQGAKTLEGRAVK